MPLRRLRGAIGRPPRLPRRTSPFVAERCPRALDAIPRACECIKRTNRLNVWDDGDNVRRILAVLLLAASDAGNLSSVNPSQRQPPAMRRRRSARLDAPGLGEPNLPSD